MIFWGYFFYFQRWLCNTKNRYCVLDLWLFTFFWSFWEMRLVLDLWIRCPSSPFQLVPLAALFLLTWQLCSSFQAASFFFAWQLSSSSWSAPGAPGSGHGVGGALVLWMRWWWWCEGGCGEMRLLMWCLSSLVQNIHLTCITFWSKPRLCMIILFGLFLYSTCIIGCPNNTVTKLNGLLWSF
jgi:hypothetical protein